MKTLILELWYKYKIRAGRYAISKITKARRSLNDKQKGLTVKVETYVKKYNDINKV